jgi:hypothetical protein
MIPNDQNQITEKPEYTKKEIEEIVKMIRLELYNKGRYCGPKAIKQRLEEYHIDSLPSESTIGCILSRHGLTHGRTGFCH